ncbi:MAG: hypothetical protein IJT94_12255 [Oscillibacter sp.]|nr:hypothetical protein [Oscillibacter sp.]
MIIFQIVTTIANLLLIAVIPLISVHIGQALQEHSENRKSKMDVFTTLMTYRSGWSMENTKAMNVINVVFADDKKVRQKWNIYYKLLCIPKPDEKQRDRIQRAQIEMLEAMAASLGYKGKVVQESIKNKYVPVGMLNAMNQQQNILDGQEAWAKSIPGLLHLLETMPRPTRPPVVTSATFSVPPTSPPQEDKPNADT